MGAVSLAALAGATGEALVERSSVGMLRLVPMGSFSALQQQQQQQQQQSGGGSKGGGIAAAASPPPRLLAAASLSHDHRLFLAAVDAGGAVLLGSREAPAAGAAAAAAAAPHSQLRRRFTREPGLGGAAGPTRHAASPTALCPNPCLPTLFAAGYRDGSVRLFSLRRSQPVATCEDPFLSSSSSASPQPPAPVACLFWVRARPTVLGCLSTSGQLALWDVAVPSATAAGSAFAPVQSFWAVPQGGSGAGGAPWVVGASCSGGGGGAGGAATLLIALSSGAAVAVALHPGLCVEQEEGSCEGALLALLRQ